MTKTFYGFKQSGKSHFVVVAPHAAGDDLLTKKFASELAEQLQAFLIVNNKYIKPSNSKAENKPRFVEDLYRLSWHKKGKKFIWHQRKYILKIFFNDIEEYTNLARRYSQEKKALIIYIHGFKNNDNVAVDLGCGTKNINEKSNKIFGLKFFNKSYLQSTGEITIRINVAKKIKKELDEVIFKNYQQHVSIGKYFTGWSKSSAIQFHKAENRNDYALQLEINFEFRQNNNKRKFLINNLSKIIKKYFV